MKDSEPFSRDLGGHVADYRKIARWWDTDEPRVKALEGHAFEDDPALKRLSRGEVLSISDVAKYARLATVDPADLLVYLSYADGLFGRYRLAVLFLFPPEQDPYVMCLDGPRGTSASEHRNGETELCLYYPEDPTQRRWTESKGLAVLLAMARQHVAAEHIWRRRGVWVLDEAPHGETIAVQQPGRNQPCSCGSGRKSKRCCWS